MSTTPSTPYLLLSTSSSDSALCFPTGVDVKFNGKNYDKWLVTVRTILLWFGLIEPINFGASTSDSSSAPAVTWRAADYRAMVIISMSVDIRIRLRIAHLTTAQEMWEHLHSISKESISKESEDTEITYCLSDEEPKEIEETEIKSSSINPRLFGAVMYPRLLGAVRSGDITQLQNLFAEDPHLLNSSTAHGNTVLHLAVIFRQERCAKELYFMCPSLLSAANGDDNTPLLLAAALGIQPIVDFVIALPASPIGDLEQGGHMLTATNKTHKKEEKKGEGRFYSMEREMEMIEEVEIPMMRPPYSGRAIPAAVTFGHSGEGNHKLRATNKMGNNALHEALRNGHVEVALVLLRAEPRLAQRVNNNGESPLYMACYRSLEVVVEKLLGLRPTATHEGPNGETALHAAVMVGNSGLVGALLNERSGLAKEAAENGGTPLHYASRFNKLAVVKLLLDSDASLAYVVDKDGCPPITWAVTRGYVRIVEEFVRRCPDSALMASNNGNTPLHIAVYHGSVEVVMYILRTPELQGLINQPNYEGDVPLHIAVRECNKKTLRALLACKSLDKEAVNYQGQTAVDVLFSHPDFTLRRVSTRKMLISAFPNHHRLARGRRPIREEKIKNQTMAPLIRNYVNNSILVATLMATITFAAAFTVPGGYDGNQGAPDEGLPILARKAAFKAFLISDTIAMCSSLAVVFLCIFAPWIDDDFLIRYVDKTKWLLFCGFAAMSVAFATGLYAVVAPGSLWLAAVICVLCCSLPLVTFLTGEWIVYGERLKLLMSTNLEKIKEKIFLEDEE